MSRPLSRSYDLICLIVLSFTGLSLSGMLMIYPPIVNENILYRKPIIGCIFGSICVLGIMAALSPTKCSKIFDSARSSNRSYRDKSVSHGLFPTTQGHHPACGKFDAHIFVMGNTTYCAACTGLILGGLLALVGTLGYFFIGSHLEINGSFNVSFMIWVGISCVGFGLFQLKFKSYIRSLFNVFFVIGSLLILIGIDVLVKSMLIDLFLIFLILFWLFTRISLSQWDHERICYTCGVSFCEFMRSINGLE